MKIGIIAGGIAPVGGIEHFLCDLSGALNGAGHEVEVVGWDVAYPQSNPVLDEMRRSAKRVTVLRVKMGCRYGCPDLATLPFAVGTSKRSDLLIFGKTLNKNFHALFKRYLLNTPSILVTPYRPSEMWQEARVPACLGNFSAIIVQSDDFIGDLRKLGYNGTISVIPYIPPVLRPVSAFPAIDLPQVGFLGRLESQKNVESLLRAMSIVCQTRDVKLNLFGHGTLADHLRSIAVDLKLQNVALFHGRLPRASIAEAIDSCHLFAFPSHTEGQCLAALEILSRGRPIVATEVGAFPALLSQEHLGRLCTENTAEALADAICKVCDRIRMEEIRPELVQATYAAKVSRSDVLSSYTAVLQRTASMRDGHK